MTEPTQPTGTVVEPEAFLGQYDDWSRGLSPDPEVINKAHDLLEEILKGNTALSSGKIINPCSDVIAARAAAIGARRYECNGYADPMLDFVEIFLREFSLRFFGDRYPIRRFVILFEDGLMCCMCTPEWQRCATYLVYESADGVIRPWTIPVRFNFKGRDYAVDIPLSLKFSWPCPRPVVDHAGTSPDD